MIFIWLELVSFLPVKNRVLSFRQKNSGIVLTGANDKESFLESFRKVRMFLNFQEETSNGTREESFEILGIPREVVLTFRKIRTTGKYSLFHSPHEMVGLSNRNLLSCGKRLSFQAGRFVCVSGLALRKRLKTITLGLLNSSVLCRLLSGG